MDIKQAKEDLKTILHKASSENRDFTEGEIKAMDEATAVIERSQNAERFAEAAEDNVIQAQDTEDINEAFRRTVKRTTTFAGPQTWSTQVVHDFTKRIPLLTEHKNIQYPSTGNTLYTLALVDSIAGAARTEGNASTTDSATLPTLVTANYALYSSRKFPISIELIEDTSVNIVEQIVTLGTSRCRQGFAAAIYTAMNAAYGKDADSSTLTIAGLQATYAGIREEYRPESKWFLTRTRLNSIAALMTSDANKWQLSTIGLSPENLANLNGIVVDESASTQVYYGDPTMGLAVGVKTPVRIFAAETSGGRDVEVQYRAAVAVQNASAFGRFDNA